MTALSSIAAADVSDVVSVKLTNMASVRDSFLAFGAPQILEPEISDDSTALIAYYQSRPKYGDCVVF